MVHIPIWATNLKIYHDEENDVNKITDQVTAAFAVGLSRSVPGTGSSLLAVHSVFSYSTSLKIILLNSLGLKTP